MSGLEPTPLQWAARLVHAIGWLVVIGALVWAIAVAVLPERKR